MDKLSPQQRSDLMRKISSRNTKPEMRVRKLLFSMGYRFRLHVRLLPGTPDIVMKGRNKIIEVRGCFWHQHPDCRYSRTPKTKLEYWLPKFQKTQDRDDRNIAAMTAAGWRVLVIWECETKNAVELEAKLRNFMEHTD